MRDASPIDTEELLGHALWVRELARRLVRDVHLADDAAQETLRLALARPPRSRSNIRGWLSVLLRNALRADHRSRSRREAREQRAASSEQMPDTREIVERLDLHRRLVEEVQQLDEPHRSVILLRFFEEKSLVEISRLVDAPVSTVSSRIQKALEELRRRLDDRHDGNRDAWVIALIPLAFGSNAPGAGSAAACSSQAAGSAAASSSQAAGTAAPAPAGIAIGVATVTIVGTLILMTVLVNLDRGKVPPVQAADVADSRIKADTSISQGQHAPTPDRGPSDSEPGLGNHPVASESTGTGAHQGRLIDADGSPLAGIELALVPTRSQDSFPNVRGDSRRLATSATETHAERRLRALQVTHSDALGRFSFQADTSSGRIVVIEPGWSTVLAGVAYDGLEDERVVIGARSHIVTGKIVDQHGTAIASASVGIRLPAGFRGRFDEVLDHSVEATWVNDTDATGTFQIAGVPCIDGCELLVDAPGFDTAQHLVPTNSASHMRITLLPEKPSGPIVRGYVTDTAGQSIADAIVSLDDRIARSNASGYFEISAGTPGVQAQRLLVARPGYQATVVDRRPGEAWPDPALITLDGEPGVLHGRVVHADGSPAPGAWVWLADPTVLPVAGQDPIVLESVLSGTTHSRPAWNITTADGRGRFRLAGLLQRDYLVRASMEGDTAMGEVRATPSHPSDADATGNSKVVLRLPGAATRIPQLSGVVVDRDGKPLPDVTVTVSSTAVDLRATGSPDPGWRWAANGPATRTNSSGEFLLRDVPRAAETLHLAGSGVFTTDLALDELIANATAGPLLISLPMRCHLRIESDGDIGPDVEFQVRTEHGEIVPTRLHIGIGNKPVHEVQLTPGASPVLAIPDSAREILFLQGNEVLDRQSIEPRPGKIVRVRPQLPGTR